jgi:hypothetical protein
MNTKRMINGTKFDIPQIVDDAITAADSMTLNTEAARQSLARLGHQNPDEKLIARYARESAILSILGRTTGANFANQIGKIDFVNREAAIQGVQSYLNRRIQGQHARWTANHR